MDACLVDPSKLNQRPYLPGMLAVLLQNPVHFPLNWPPLGPQLDTTILAWNIINEPQLYRTEPDYDTKRGLSVGSTLQVWVRDQVEWLRTQVIRQLIWVGDVCMHLRCWGVHYKNHIPTTQIPGWRTH